MERMAGAAAGPAQRPRPAGAGVEVPETRPGVPMEAPPHPAPAAYWEVPARQQPRVTVLRRAGLAELTPVFGTAQPPRGASGLLRRVAYRIPEHRARHWILLVVADRVDVLEGRLGRALAAPLRHAGLARLGRRVERNPVPALLLVAAAGWLARRARAR